MVMGRDRVGRVAVGSGRVGILQLLVEKLILKIQIFRNTKMRFLVYLMLPH